MGSGAEAQRSGIELCCARLCPASGRLLASHHTCDTSLLPAQLEVQTAIRDGEWEAGQPRNARRDKAAVQAAFLADPERAREAIRLAIRLHHRRRTATTAPVQAAPMAQAAAANGDSGGSAAGGGGSAAGGGGLAERLARMQALVARGTLTAEEAAGVRAAPEDPTARLVEAADLAATGAIAAEELAEVKARWLAALA